MYYKVPPTQNLAEFFFLIKAALVDHRNNKEKNFAVLRT